MKHVAIHAYPFGNVGDDLFILTLCERYPHVQFHLALTMDYAKAFLHVPNLTLHNKNSIRFRLQRLFHKESFFPRVLEEKFDGTVFIGGSIFMEQTGWEKSFIQMKQMQQTGKPFFIIGANFGPYQSTLFFNTYETFFKHVESISLRDYFSYNLLSHLENVRYAPDVLFTLHKKLTLTPISQEKNVLISVIYPSERADLMLIDERYFSSIARLVNDAHNQGYTVTLTAFCSYEGDDAAVVEILKRVSALVRKNVHVHIYDGDISVVYNLFQRATFVVATRFHAMILGWLFGKNVFPITYSEKMNHVLRDLAYTGDFQEIQSINTDIIERIFANEPTDLDLQRLAKDAEIHFSTLDQLLPRE